VSGNHLEPPGSKPGAAPSPAADHGIEGTTRPPGTASDVVNPATGTNGSGPRSGTRTTRRPVPPPTVRVEK